MEYTQEIRAIFIHIRLSPKNTVWTFFWINFSLDILSGKLTKFAGHFRNLAVLFDRLTVFAKTAPFAHFDDINFWQNLF